MNQDIIDDLKQFVAATVMQSTTDIRSDITDLDKKINDTKKEILNAIGQVLDTHN